MNTLVTRYPFLTAFISLQVIDFSTTWLGVTLLGAHEVNPVGKIFIHSLGLLGTLIAFKAWACCWALLGVRKEGDLVLRRAAWIYGVAMTWNIMVLTTYASKLVGGL